MSYVRLKETDYIYFLYMKNLLTLYNLEVRPVVRIKSVLYEDIVNLVF